MDIAQQAAAYLADREETAREYEIEAVLDGRHPSREWALVQYDYVHRDLAAS